MSRETGSIELSAAAAAPGLAIPVNAGVPPYTLPRLATGVLLIALCAMAISCLLAIIVVLLLYARTGIDGVTEFYQELRFDFRLKTLVGAIVVGMLYVGTGAATVCAAMLRTRHGWPALVGWARVRERHRLLPAILATTLLYAIAATLTIALRRTTPVIVNGNTDYALICAITVNLVLLAPVAEELFFRGWLYTGLRARLAFWPSFLTTAALFAAIHWDASHRRILLVLPLAVALGVLREVTGSIKPTIALHSAYNLIIVVVTLLVT